MDIYELVIKMTKKMKKIIIIPDVHLITDVPKPYEVVKKFLKKQKFDEVVLLGDFMDVSALSYFDKDKRRKMEGRRYEKEIATANKELDFIQKHVKKVTYLCGNHEQRVESYVDHNPEMEGLIEIPKLLHLKERGIKWVEYNDLYKVGRLYMTHGCYYNKYYAKKSLDMFGCNLVVGHVHRPDLAFTTAKMVDEKMCWGLGCLCDMEPEYMKGRPANWANGFAVAYIKDNGKFSMYPIHISKKGHFVYEGVEYK